MDGRKGGHKMKNITRAMQIEKLIQLEDKAIKIVNEQIEIMQQMQKAREDLIELRTNNLYGKHA